MSLSDYVHSDHAREIRAGLREVANAISTFTTAYVARTKVEQGKVDALTRIAAALERDNE